MTRGAAARRQAGTYEHRYGKRVHAPGVLLLLLPYPRVALRYVMRQRHAAAGPSTGVDCGLARLAAKG